jgi:hypothetical protein
MCLGVGTFVIVRGMKSYDWIGASAMGEDSPTTPPPSNSSLFELPRAASVMHYPHRAPVDGGSAYGSTAIPNSAHPSPPFHNPAAVR